MPSCTTWCATSSAPCCRSGAASSREAWVAELLAGRDRTVAGPTAPPSRAGVPRSAYTRGLFGLPDEVSAVSQTLFRTRIKFCGMTRAGDVRLASELGVDAVGFVFADRQPAPARSRRKRGRCATRWRRWSMRSRCSWTTAPTKCARSIRQVRPSLLQFHGGEDDAFCRGFGVPYLKAHPDGRLAPAQRAGTRRSCAIPGAAASCSTATPRASRAAAARSSTGRRVPTGLGKPFVLAGGLRPDNVFDAMHADAAVGRGRVQRHRKRARDQGRR